MSKHFQQAMQAAREKIEKRIDKLKQADSILAFNEVKSTLNPATKASIGEARKLIKEFLQ